MNRKNNIFRPRVLLVFAAIFLAVGSDCGAGETPPPNAGTDKPAAPEENFSALVSLDNQGGVVLQPYTPQGDILPDFSYCGFGGGGIALPEAPVLITLSPSDGTGDDTARIQAALDTAGGRPVDAGGIRGAVLLKKGKYRLASTLFLGKSGVVLRGEGSGAGGTLLVGTSPWQYDLISVGGREGRNANPAGAAEITDEYVPSGTKGFSVQDASGFREGDDVIIERPSTKEWISVLGMDKMKPRSIDVKDLPADTIEKLKSQGLLGEGDKKLVAAVQWEPGTKNLKFERRITAIEGCRITVDVPVTNAFQREFGGGKIFKYSYDDRISHVGVENLAAESLYDPTVVTDTDNLKGYPADEKHAWTFLKFETCENVWARNLRCSYFSFGITTGTPCRYATIQDCEVLDPVCIVMGNRRYSYYFRGQMGLVQRCYSRNGRHDFSVGSTVAGPNAFVDCRSELAQAASEPHHRWAAGCLWDNCEVSGPNGFFSFSNRGNMGPGHGWAGAQMVMWNCSTPLAVVMSPPTAMNFSIGTKALKTEWSTPETLQTIVDRINSVAGTNFRYAGLPVVGDGFIESQNRFVIPRSLYRAQLSSRLRAIPPLP